MRPTQVNEPKLNPDEPEVEENVEPVDGQGRGDVRAAAAVAAAGVTPKARRRRPSAPLEKTNKRGLNLTDSVWDRLQLEAIRRRTTVSAIAGDVLERNLPRLRIERDL